MDSLKDAVVDVPDFPRKGILFRDITPILANPKHFTRALELMGLNVPWSNVDVVVGLESRGFILGAALAAMHGKGFVPMRRAGKLPPPVLGQVFKLEWGETTYELKAGSGRALMVDDVMATGGTLEAAVTLCTRAGYDVVDAAVLINLRILNRFTIAGHAPRAAIEY